LATFAWGVVHSLLASLSVKQLARRMFGSGVDRWYRIIYNLIAIATSLLIFILPLTLPDRLIYIISFPWVLITLFIQVASLILLLIGLYQTGAGTFFGISQLFGKSASLLPGVLITNGLYRYVRHPLYTAGLLFIWLSPILTVNLIGFFFAITVYVIIGALLEERRLLQEHGEKYRQYLKVTPFLIPRLVFHEEHH
jgi:protein-S-isoprenylcysteine O-methyltransferase Ste14